MTKAFARERGAGIIQTERLIPSTSPSASSWYGASPVDEAREDAAEGLDAEGQP